MEVGDLVKDYDYGRTAILIEEVPDERPKSRRFVALYDDGTTFIISDYYDNVVVINDSR